MLVLSRQIGERIIIAGDICVTVLQIDRERVRLGVTAPPTVRVDRQEIDERRKLTAERGVPSGLTRSQRRRSR
jgi:carbon storage regulator